MASETWTVRRMLQWMTEDFRKRSISSARLDAELLVGHVLGSTRLALYMDLDRPLLNSEREALRVLVERRRNHEPVAYLLGEREFYSRPFAVTPAVLIPRPDTETLVDRALELIDALQVRQVLDLCTGSGAIAVTLAAERPDLKVDASDVSAAALEVARGNATRHQVQDRVHFLLGDLLEPVPSDRRYGLVVCNPPYIAETDWAELPADVRDHEPALALRGGTDGLDVYRRLVARIDEVLTPEAAVLLEVGQGQAAAVTQLFAAGFAEVRVLRDLGGVDRVVEARRWDGGA